MTADFFRNRLDQMIDLRHPLAVLANRMPWQELEASLAHRFARQVRAGKRIEDMDLFGPSVSVVGSGVAAAGRPRLPTRLMVALLYLKHAFNESDEEVVQRWGETGACQDSYRLIHARRAALFSADVGVSMGSESRSGLSLTTAM